MELSKITLYGIPIVGAFLVLVLLVGALMVFGAIIERIDNWRISRNVAKGRPRNYSVFQVAHHFAHNYDLLNFLRRRAIQHNGETPRDILRYPSFGRRTLAFLIDVLALNGISFVLGFGFALAGELGMHSLASPDLNAILIALGLVAGWLYYAGLESSDTQATIGKRALGIRVADGEGHRISFGRATARHFGKVLSVLTFGIGFIMAAFTKRHQALHDVLSGCVVIRTTPAIATGSPVTEPISRLSATQ